ncbi:hypothetical protein DICVIV_04042 [Dictyocaulus viviparus]|uniref:Uncharacterized protein n=1 Tax=Dictyocaulus viviparus TaxID=29172 RepID=A0A0D8Y178_DICVI|nr:hypothetical protein DICVIV_04042 [Dictyocaulus viviparus]
MLRRINIIPEIEVPDSGPDECIVVKMSDDQMPFKMEPVNHEDTVREALTNLLLDPNDVVQCIRKCMGRGCYIEEEAIQLISEAAQYRLHEIVEELVNVATFRVRNLDNLDALLEEESSNVLGNKSEMATLSESDSSTTKETTYSNTDTSDITSNSDLASNRSINEAEYESEQMEIHVDEQQQPIEGTAAGETAPKFTHLGRIYSAAEREPGKIYQRIIRVNTDDLHLVAYENKFSFGPLISFKLATRSFTAQ